MTSSSRGSTVSTGPPRALLDVAADRRPGGRARPPRSASPGSPTARPAPPLRELVDSALLVPASVDGRDGYAFRHALLREAVLDTFLPTESRRLHSAFAEALADERRGRGRPERVPARRARASLARGPRPAGAGCVDRGWRRREGLTRVRCRLSRVRARAAAVGRAPARTSVDIDHVALLERAAVAAYLASDHRRAVDLRREALAELGPDTDPAVRSRHLVQLGRALWVWGEYRQSVEAYEEALRVVPDDAPEARAQGAVRASGRSTCSSTGSGARSRCSRKPSSWRAALGARGLEGHALNSLGTSLGGHGADRRGDGRDRRVTRDRARARAPRRHRPRAREPQRHHRDERPPEGGARGRRSRGSRSSPSAG